MSDASKNGGFHPFKRSHRGTPNPIWLNTQTAPFQVPITLYLMLLGIQVMIGGIASPDSLTDSYPLWVVINWAVSLAVGCAMSLYGRYVEKFRLESAGLAFVLYSCMVYAVTVVVINGWTAIFASGAYFAIATGCIIRMIVIAKSHKAQKLAGRMIRERNGDAPHD